MSQRMGCYLSDSMSLSPNTYPPSPHEKLKGYCGNINVLHLYNWCILYHRNRTFNTKTIGSECVVDVECINSRCWVLAYVNFPSMISVFFWKTKQTKQRKNHWLLRFFMRKACIAIISVVFQSFYTLKDNTLRHKLDHSQFLNIVCHEFTIIHICSGNVTVMLSENMNLFTVIARYRVYPKNIFLLMSWRLASPDHHHPRYRTFRINVPLLSTTRDYKYLGDIVLYSVAYFLFIQTSPAL